MAIDAQWSSVVLLLPLSSDLLDVKSHSVTAYGGAALSSSVGDPFGAGNALYLNGTTQYLQIPDSADFTLAASDFTVEAWVRFIAHTSNFVIIGQRDTSTSNHAFTIEYQTSNNLRFSYTTNGSTLITVDRSWTPSDGVWYHVSAIRSGTVLQLKINGVQLGADYSIGADSIYNSTSTVKVGAINSTAAGFLNGYIGPLRLTRDDRTIVAAPTDPFPRPTISGTVYDDLAAPEAKTVLVYDRSTNEYVGGANSDPTTGQYTFYPPDFGEFKVERIDELADPYWNDVALAARLTGANGGTSFPVLVGPALSNTGTVTTTTTTPTTDPFGTGSSTLFTGAGSYLSTGANAAMLPGTAYTISGWVYLSAIDATNTGMVFIGDTASDVNRTSISVSPAGSISFYAQATSSVHSANSADGVITTGAWIHFAAVRNGANALVFVGGAHVASAAATGTESTGNNFHLGASRSGGAIRGMQGNLFDVQYTKRAVWLSNFTPPPAPFHVAPADGGSGENAIIYDRVIPG